MCKGTLVRIALALLIGGTSVANAQTWNKQPITEKQPLWEQQLWAQPWEGTSQDKVKEIQEGYEQYRERNPEAPIHYADRYLRAWVRHNLLWGNEQRRDFSLAGEAPSVSEYAPESLGTWTPLGPTYVHDGANNPSGEQANIYTLAQAGGKVLYAGTEAGQVYRSSDQGLHWTLTALQVPFTGGIQALAGNPLDSQTVYAGTNNALYRSVDAGRTWSVIRQSSTLGPNELLVAHYDTSVVYAATEDGLLRSANRGSAWTLVVSQPTYDVKFLSGTLLGTLPGKTVYALSGSGQQRAVFHRSNDYGQTFTVQSSGWYQSTDTNRLDMGGRLAVSLTDSNRVYAYLIGDAKSGDYGFIGIYKSTDRGSTWTLPRGYTGAPYTATAPNTAIGNAGWTYHQGFYNCALLVHPTNPDYILIGGMSHWKSTDGGATAIAIAGYASNTLSMHVDVQDFRFFSNSTGGNTTWITTDGGIYSSSDFAQSQPTVRMRGVQATEFWGLGQGWNEDILVAGAYHNGVLARRESYPSGLFMQLGGGEPASGYADPMTDGRVYSSEIGGVQLPAMPGAATPPQYFGFTSFPNESYWPSEASTMVFDPRTPSEILLGIQHKLMRSTDAGRSYQIVNAFGSDPNKKLGMVVQGFQQPNVLYVVQRESWAPAKLHRSLDSGGTWSAMALPTGTGGRMVLALSPNNAQHIVAVFPSGPNGKKVYQSFNGGQQWTNWTTPVLQNNELRAIARVHGVSPGWVVAGNKEVFFRYDTSATWQVMGQGLPHPVQTRDVAVHYGLGKIRIATYGRGMWECDVPSPVVLPLAQPMVSRRAHWRVGCTFDSVRFASRSIVPRNGTSTSWRFPGGSPSVSSAAYPSVWYAQPGTYTAWLKVTHLGNVDSNSVTLTIAHPTGTMAMADFEGALFPDAYLWQQAIPPAVAWERSEWATGNHAARVDNYNYDAQGAWSDLAMKVDKAHAPQLLRYQYAYAPYGAPYLDTLLVVVSANCDLSMPVWVDTLAHTRLQTAPLLTSQLFVPASATEWKKDSVDFNHPSIQGAFQNTPALYVGFRNIGRWGQALYLDNIALSYNIGLPEPSVEISKAAFLYPNPALSGSSLRLVPTVGVNARLEWFTPSSKRLGSALIGPDGQVQAPHGYRGLALWRIITEDGVWAGSVVLSE